ncbi:uncharacterized protein BYT42DRAFT_572872 [Radiomyces spectabilis]|uniref:uncharacterized protein n=1 Tax=Radiomyces spectabilis TaxID=64574 RepID=UPI002220138A|nr:uncharacterized protein BYT42DRAFT_572872 [Radiomyces spectabilis]KAI8375952.1 hypothetical protein BYT42DRAFT_572872 [Radiomyces spectabilis]
MKNKEDATLEVILDPNFTGTLRGLANDVSEGCVLKGVCLVQVYRPIKVRRLFVRFEGRCRVNIKCSTVVGMPSSDGLESRTLILKETVYIDGEPQAQVLEPGLYRYPFSFDIPGKLPATLYSKRGYICYRLKANLCRPIFVNDLRVSQDITLRRCLMSELTPMLNVTEEVQGKENSDILDYKATAPSMVYREGGLIRLNLDTRLVDPSTYSIRSISCALRERVSYSTTGKQSLTSQTVDKVDDLYPLGWSTFYPSEAADYDPTEAHQYNAVIRVCPRVNADTTCRLLRAEHTVVVNILVENHSVPAEEGSFSDTVSSSSSSIADSPPAARSVVSSLSRSSSSSSLSSLFTLGRSHSSDDDIKNAITSLSTLEVSSKRSRRTLSNMTLCTLELPIIVTSRENVWEGDMPPLPTYELADEPPSYGQSLHQCPPAPMYPDTANTIPLSV